MNKKRALFLDRDGVICKALPRGEYLVEWNQFELMDGIRDLIRAARERGYLVVVATNQAPVARKMLTVQKLEDIHRRMQESLHYELDKIYYCPHQPSDNCLCRKPKPGMFHRASRELAIDITESFFVGDSGKDVEAGKSAGCSTIFLRNEYNEGELAQCSPDFVIQNLFEAVSVLK